MFLKHFSTASASFDAAVVYLLFAVVALEGFGFLVGLLLPPLLLLFFPYHLLSSLIKFENLILNSHSFFVVVGKDHSVKAGEDVLVVELVSPSLITSQTCAQSCTDCVLHSNRLIFVKIMIQGITVVFGFAIEL